MENPTQLPTQFFYALTPEAIDNSCLQCGLKPTGRVLALNSLENRVYEVEVDGLVVPTGPFATESVIVKFYRPGRWTKETIQEEHKFLQELHELEVPVVAPITYNGKTLFQESSTGLFYSLSLKVRGRLKDELNQEEIAQIGRLVGRIHNIGSVDSFQHRLQFGTQNFIDAHFEVLRKADFLPKHTVDNYIALAQQISQLVAPYLKNLKNQRIHGDLHRGNVLWTHMGPWMVDFDDSMMGPREQDLWLLLPGRDSYSLADRELFLEAYHLMARDPVSLNPFLIEALRTLRMIHFNGWIAKRWEDPAFQNTYVSFSTHNHWESQLLDLKEQLGLLQDNLSN